MEIKPVCMPSLILQLQCRISLNCFLLIFLTERIKQKNAEKSAKIKVKGVTPLSDYTIMS